MKLRTKEITRSITRLFTRVSVRCSKATQILFKPGQQLQHSTVTQRFLGKPEYGGLPVKLVSNPIAFGRANALRKLYPNHALVMSSDHRLNILGFPAVYARPLSPSEQVSNLVFIPLARRLGSVPGVLADNVEFGGFSVAWKARPYSILFSLHT